MKRAIAVCVILIVAGQANAALDIIPAYQVNGNDYTWTETVNIGEYTVPTEAEDYENEIWERSVQDDEWFDSGDIRTSEKMYYAYGDLKSGAWGVGTSGGTDYLFVKWEVVGNFQQEVGLAKETKLLEGHY